MTDKQRQMIADILPHPRDPELEFDQYYVKDTSDRVRKVRITTILPGAVFEENTYVVREVSTGRIIDAGYGDPWHGFSKAKMYDNRQDCKDDTHWSYSDWEDLRELQMKEQEAEDGQTDAG